MNKHYLTDPVSGRLQEIFKEYKLRTDNTMLNFSLGRTINKLVCDALTTLSENQLIELLKLDDLNIIASDNNPISATTVFKVSDVIKTVKTGEFINTISKAALVELVAALDQVMVRLIDYFLPNLLLDKNRIKNKKILVSYSGKYIKIDSKTLIYPYVIYRHCFEKYDCTPPILCCTPRAMLWIRDSIALRHSIIHNDSKFEEREIDQFITGYVKKEINAPLTFDENIIDSIYWYHIDHVLDFIKKMDKNGNVNFTEAWSPNQRSMDDILFKYENELT